MTRFTFGSAALLVAFCCFSGCSFFSRPPALPRRAAIEPTGSEEKFASAIDEADIIYFPSESVTLESRSEAAWKLLEALKRGGRGFAVGWDATSNESDRRRYLEEAGGAGGEVLTLHELKPRAESEGVVSMDELVAEEIANYFREHRNDKVLAFLRRDRLGVDHGVPYLVAQKTKARQLILNPRRHRDAGPRLLARNSGRNWSGRRLDAGRFEVIDRAPVAGGDER